MKTFPIVSSPHAPRFLAKLWATGFLISVATVPLTRAAGLIDDFSYPDGGLTAVSGGAWQLWEAGAEDAAVSGGAMRFQGNTDVIRTFPPVLTEVGETASISFSILVNIADTTEGFAMDFLPASAPFAAPGGTNYENQFSLGFDYQSRDLDGNPLPADGLASIDIGTGTGSDTVVTRLGGLMTENVIHRFRIDLKRKADNTAYSLFMDGNVIHQGSFVLTDPRGMNAVELEQSGEQSPSTTAFAIVDDLKVIQEPEIVVMQPAGSNLTDGSSKRSFGTVNIGSKGITKTFTVKNTGTANLSGLSIRKDGSHKADFKVGALGNTTLPPGAKTTFKVTFKPKAKGKRSAAIHIKSNDANENPFDIKLTGKGAIP